MAVVALCRQTDVSTCTLRRTTQPSGALPSRLLSHALASSSAPCTPAMRHQQMGPRHHHAQPPSHAAATLGFSCSTRGFSSGVDRMVRQANEPDASVVLDQLRSAEGLTQLQAVLDVHEANFDDM